MKPPYVKTSRRKKRWVVTFILTDKPNFLANESFMRDAKEVKHMIVNSLDFPAGVTAAHFSVVEGAELTP